jgi:hypothetical protein
MSVPRRTIAAVVAVAAVATTSVVVVTSGGGDVLEASDGPLVIEFANVDAVTGEPFVPISDGVSALAVTIRNDGDVDSSSTGEATLLLDLPEGLEFVEVLDPDGGAGAGVGGLPEWSCDAPADQSDATAVELTGVDVVCSHTFDGETAHLPAGGVTGAVVLVRAVDGAPHDRVIVVRSEVTGVDGPAFAGARTVATGEGSPVMVAAYSGDSLVMGGQAGVTTAHVVNIGSGPTAGPGTVLADVVPEGLVSAWSSSGDGWECSGPTVGPVRCANAAVVGVGEVLPDLTVEWIADGFDELAAVDEPLRLDWLSSATAEGPAGSGAGSSSSQRLVIVLPPPAPVFGVHLSSGASSHVMPGERVAVDLNLSVPQRGLTDVSVSVEVPAGLTFVALDDARCVGSALVVCALDDIAEGDPRTHSLIFEAETDAPEGAVDVAVTVSADGVEPLSDAHQFVVVGGGDPSVAGVVVLRSVGGHTAIVDGRDLVADEDEPVRFGVRVHNVGPVVVPSGTTGTVVWEQPIGAGRATVTAPDGTSCARSGSGAVRWVCGFTLDTDLEPGASGPVVSISVNGNGPGDDIDLGSVITDLDLTGHVPHSLDLSVDVTGSSAELRPRLEVNGPLTAGGSGEVSVHVTSFGDDVEGVPAFTADLPSGVTATPSAGSGCTVDGTRLICLFPSLEAGASSAAIVVPVSVDATVEPGTHPVGIAAGDLLPDGSIADDSHSSTTVDIVIRPMLTASAEAWPSVVVPNPTRSAQVVALVASSVAHDGTAGTESTWVQRCVSPGDVGVVEGCTAVTPDVAFLDAVGARTTRVSIPNPDVDRTYVFEYRHSDGSHSVGDVVTVAAQALDDLESAEVELPVSAAAAPVAIGQASVADGMSLGGGFVLSNLSGGLTNGATITGTLQNTVRGGSWPFSMTYWSDDNWSMSIAQGSGSGSFRVFSGWSVPAADLHGSIGRNGGESINWSFGYSGQQETLTLSTGVTFSSGSFSIQSQCSPGAAIAVTCPNGGGAFVSAGGTVSVSNSWAGNWSMSVSMYVGLDGDEAVIAGNVPCCGLPLFSSFNVFIAEYGDVGGDGAAVGGVELQGDSTNQWRAWIQSSFTIPNSGIDGTGYFRLVDGHVVLGATAGGSTGSGGSFSGSFVWTNDPNGVEVTAGGLTKEVPEGGQGFAGTYFVGRVTAPEWVSQVAGVSNLTLDVFGENGTRGGIDLRAEVQGSMPIPLPGSGVSLAFTGMYVGISKYSDNPPTIHVGGEVTLSSSGGGGMGSSSVALAADFSADQFGQSVSATFSLDDPNGWRNAFGVDGLTLKDLMVSFQMTRTNWQWSPPSVGLHATAELPGSVTGPLSISTGTVAMATMVLSETSPCLSIQVGSQGGPTVITLQGGLLDSSYFEFTAAPRGCTVGSTNIEPGYSLAFDGHVMGVPVEVGARLTVDPMSFTASVDVGTFEVVGLHFSETRLNIDITPSQSTVAFSGGMSFAGSTVSVSGRFDRSGGTTTITGTIGVDRLALGPFALTDTSMTVTVKSGAENDVEVSGRGAFDLMGTQIDVREFDLVLANGVVERVSFEVDARVSVSSLTFDGRFGLQFDRSNPDATVVSGSVTARTAEGLTLASGSITVTPTSAQFAATVDVGSVFSAAVSGSLFHGQPPSGAAIRDANGNTVAARQGDFRFSVDQVHLDIAGLSAEGSFAVGNVSGNRFARVSADLRVGSSYDGATVRVVGEVNGDGSFDLTGSGSLTIGGWSGVRLDVSANRQSNGSVSVSGSGSIDIRGLTVSVSGSFSNQGGYPSTTLTGSASGAIDGWNFGSISVTVQQSPSAQGVSAAVSLNAGPIGANGSISYRQENGDVLFDASLNGSLNLPVGGFSASVGVDFGNINGYHFDISGTLSFSGFSWSASWSVGTSGSFGFEKTSSNSWSASGGDWALGGGVDGGYTAHVQFNQSGVNAYADVWGDVWGEIAGKKFTVGVDFSAEFNPFKVCADIHVGVHITVCL